MAENLLCVQRDIESAMIAEDLFEYQYLVGIVRATEVRTQALDWLKTNNLHSPVYIHNLAFVASLDLIDVGTIIFPHSNILTSQIGQHCMFAPFTHVGHNAQVLDSCLFLPYSATLGSSKIGSFTILQTRSTVVDWVQINVEHANLLPNSLLTKHIDKSGTYGGSPARWISSDTTKTAKYFSI